jgi:hypothetical protein
MFSFGVSHHAAELTLFTLIKIDYDIGENRAYRGFATREEAEDALEALRPYIEHAYPTCLMEGAGSDGLLTVATPAAEHLADYVIAGVEDQPQNFA